jgi:hypothetical protein
MLVIRRLIFASVSALALACAGCGAATPPAGSTAEASARDASAMDMRLQGAWRLVDFRPAVAPDVMFQALLASQVGTMVVRFDHGMLYADSDVFHVMRPYRVASAAGSAFTIESPDVGGAVFASNALLSDDGRTISFTAQTDPWRGNGTLARAQ